MKTISRTILNELEGGPKHIIDLIETVYGVPNNPSERWWKSKTAGIWYNIKTLRDDGFNVLMDKPTRTYSLDSGSYHITRTVPKVERVVGVLGRGPKTYNQIMSELKLSRNEVTNIVAYLKRQNKLNRDVVSGRLVSFSLKEL